MPQIRSIFEYGYGGVVAMNMDACEALQYNQELYHRLKEAELQAVKTNMRHTHEDVFSDLRQELEKKD